MDPRDPADLKEFLEDRARQDWAPNRRRLIEAVRAESLILRREATTWRNGAQGCESDSEFEGALNEADKLDMRANDLEDAAAMLSSGEPWPENAPVLTILTKGYPEDSK